MRPNYDAGKTEALTCFQGPGSRAAKQACFKEGAGRAAFHALDGQHSLRCVLHYKHLGTVLTAKGVAMPAIRANVAHAKGAVGPLTKPVFRNQNAPFSTRAILLRSLGLSRASHGASTWRRLTKAESQAWEHGVAYLLRALLPENRHTGESTYASSVKIAQATGFPLPTELLAFDRLRHLVLIAAGQQSSLWELLQAEAAICANAWLSRAQEDLNWLASLVPDAQLPHSPVLVYNASPAGLRRFRAAIRKGFMVVGQKNYRAYLVAQNDPARAPDADKDCNEQPFACGQCEASFTCVHAVRAHRFAKHNLRPLVERYTAADTCRVCLCKFWSRSRLLRHVSHDSPTCGWALIAAAKPVLIEEIRAVEKKQAALQRTSGGARDFKQLPSCRLPGPLQPVPDSSAAVSPDLCHEALNLRELEKTDFQKAIRVFLDEFVTASKATKEFVYNTLLDWQCVLLQQLAHNE